MNTFQTILKIFLVSALAACGASPDQPALTPIPPKPVTVVYQSVVPPYAQYPEIPKGAKASNGNLRPELALHILFLVTGTVGDASVLGSCENLRFELQMLPRLHAASSDQARVKVGFRSFDASKAWSPSFARLFAELGIDRSNHLSRMDLVLEGKNCSEKESELKATPSV